jgi:hypothetical protein
MNKWVIILVVVTLAIGASSSVVFALTAGLLCTEEEDSSRDILQG